MNYLMKRLREPSTWGGLAALTYGVGEVAKINEAGEVGRVVEQIGGAVAGGADPVTAGVMLLGGLFSVFMGEKGGR